MDFSWVDSVVGAGIVLVGMSVGKRRANKPKPYQEPKPICGCGHHRSFHENGTGKCHKVNFDPCQCQGYHGPEPIPEYYA